MYPELQILTEPLSLLYSALSLVPWPTNFQSSQLPYHLLLCHTVWRSQLFGIQMFFISDNHRPSCSYKKICLYSKIQKDFTRLILNDPFLLMFIPFQFNVGSIHSTNCLTNMSFDSIKPSFILFMSKFKTFTYNMFNCLISPTTHSTFCLFL